MASIKRLKEEVKEMLDDPPLNCSAGPISDDDIYHWHATIFGPEDTPYYGGVFQLDIQFSKEYPFKPPQIKFVTRVLHPNVSKHGNICLDILKEEWTPALRISKVLLSICSLLANPNPEDPLDTNIAEIYVRNKTQYNQIVSEFTRKFAN